MTPNELSGMLDSLRCWVESAIVEAGCPKPTRSNIAAGTIAWDGCDQLTVSVAGRIYRSVEFPAEYRGPERCFDGYLVVPVAIVWTRCSPTQDARQNPPTPAAIAEAHTRIYNDAALVWNLVESGTLPNDEWERTGITQEFVGPVGDMVAVDTRVTIGVGHEVWC